MCQQSFCATVLTMGCVCLAAVSSALAQPSDRREDFSSWPAFLSGGASPNLSSKLPLAWSPGQEAWRVDLTGTGQSSPVAWENSIYVTTVEGPKKDRCIVTCIDALTGKKRWESSIASSNPVDNTHYVSRAGPTPACDRDGVYAFFESGDVVGFSQAGEEMWKRSLTQDYGPFKNEFGLAASVAQSGKAIYILVDHAGDSYLVALSKTDGKTLWKCPRGERGQSYSSPVCWRVGEREQVIVSSAGSVDGYDCASGTLAWTFDDVGGNTGATPIMHSSGSFLISGRTGAGSAELVKTMLGGSKVAKSNLMARFDPSTPQSPLKVEWIATKVKGSLSSPVIHEGYAYFTSAAGVVYCVDTTNGELCFEKRLPCGACWASPIATADRIYFFGNRGATTVLAIGKEYKELAANNRLWEKTETESAMAGREGPTHYATIALNDALIMRTGEAVFCFRSQ